MAKPNPKPFAQFMARCLAPGPIDFGSRTLDVRRLDGVQPQLLQVINNRHNDWLSWLESAPRSVDDPQAARADWFQPSARPKAP